MEQINKIKYHLRRNKTKYLVGASVATTAGFTYLIMRSCHAAVPSVADGPIKVTVQPISFFSRQDNSVTTTIHRGGGGSPSYIVECLETGEAWLSQRQAALAKGISDSNLSSHLNGKFENANGLHFRRVGLATA